MESPVWSTQQLIIEMNRADSVTVAETNMGGKISSTDSEFRSNTISQFEENADSIEVSDTLFCPFNVTLFCLP